MMEEMEIERDEFCTPRTKPNGALYEIHIKEGYNDNLYSLSMSKLYGCMHGMGVSANSIEEIKENFSSAVSQWETYDSIVGRESDKVTEKNLWFTDKCDTGLTKALLMGNEGLSRWMNG